MEIREVKERKDGVKYIIIPKKSEIKKEDLVLITKNLKMITKFQTEEKNEDRK